MQRDRGSFLNHLHYKVHRDFVEGGFAHPDNPPQVESAIPGCSWYLNSNPSWNEDTLYRLKPRMRSRTVTYPEPMRLIPAQVSKLWFVVASYKGPYQVEWHDCAPYRQILKAGMCFSTEADAQVCYDALFGAHK